MRLGEGCIALNHLLSTSLQGANEVYKSIQCRFDCVQGVVVLLCWCREFVTVDVTNVSDKS
jgi:hypothetical protein